MSGNRRKPIRVVTTYSEHQKTAYNLDVIAKYLAMHLKHVKVCKADSTPDPETCSACKLILIGMNSEIMQ